MEKKLKILWNSNAPFGNSGYSMMMAEVLPKIKEMGYMQAIIAFYGLEGGIIGLDGILHYPKVDHVYGSDAMWKHAKQFHQDVTISNQDIWTLVPQDLAQIPRWIPWLPVDHEHIPPPVLDKLKYAYRIISYSKFGEKKLQERGLHSVYIPPSVNTNLFKPFGTKKELKERNNLDPKTFIFGMVAANRDNPPRKSFQEVMDAFAMFLKNHPQSMLYIHTEPDNPMGFPLKAYAKRLGIDQHMMYPDDYEMRFLIKKEHMPEIFNSFDCLLSPSKNEGFGVPIIEAAACGVPAIVNDFTSMPELIVEGKTGYKTAVAAKVFDGLQEYISIPSTRSIFENMEKVYRADLDTMGKEARTFAVENYDTDMIMKTKWAPFLQTVEEEIYGKPTDSPLQSPS